MDMRWIRMQLDQMQNQRLLYSQSKRPRVGSVNKENNLKLFNDSLISDSLPFNNDSLPFNKRTTDLRYDYDNSTRISSRIPKNITEDFVPKVTQKSPISKTPQLKQLNRSFQLNLPSFQQSTKKIAHSSSQQQIESYTNKLLQNNQLYQQQIFQLKQQNSKLKSEIENSLAENIKFRMSTENREDEIKDKFTQQITQLVKELKDILSAKEQMEQEYNKYIQELMDEHIKEIEGRQEKFVKAQDFFKQKMSNMKNHLSLNKEEKEKQYFQASECKLRLMKQIDELNFSLQKERTQKRQMQRSNEQMVKIVKSIQKQLREKKQSLEKSEVQVFRIQKEKNQIIIDLRTQNKALSQKGKQSENTLEQLDTQLDKKENQLTRLQKDYNDIKKELDQKTKTLLQANSQLQEQKNQRKSLEEQTFKQTNSFTNQKQQFQGLIQQLETTLKSLSLELSQRQKEVQSCEKQLTSLSSQLQTLQKQNSKLSGEMSQLQEMNKKYKKDNVQFLQELQLLTLQNKSMKEEKVLRENQLRTLEQMCEQLQRSRDKSKQVQCVNMRRSEDNQKLQAVRVKERNNEVVDMERLLKRKYQTDITNLKYQNSALRQEIQSVVDEYERKLKEKEEKWQKRVENIQTELEGFLQRQQTRNYEDKPTQEQYQGNVDRRYETTNKGSQRKQIRSPYITKNTGLRGQPESYFKRPEILNSLGRQDVMREEDSPKQNFPRQVYERRDMVQDNNEEKGIRRRQNRYYEDIQKRLNEFSHSRKLYQ